MPIQTATVTCPYCGGPLAEYARFCSNCGQSVAVETQRLNSITTPSYETYVDYEITEQDKQRALYCHLATLIGWIIPFGDLITTVLLWSSYKNTSRFVDEQAKEALNYQINFYLWTSFFVLLSCVWIGIPFLILLALVDITVPIIAAVRARDGRSFRYPLIIRIIK